MGLESVAKDLSKGLGTGQSDEQIPSVKVARSVLEHMLSLNKYKRPQSRTYRPHSMSKSRDRQRSARRTPQFAKHLHIVIMSDRKESNVSLVTTGPHADARFLCASLAKSKLVRNPHQHVLETDPVGHGFVR
jgi:hypothetical protein